MIKEKLIIPTQPDDYESINDGNECPKCGSMRYWETCWHCGGEGEFDLHEEDAINYAPGEEYEECCECRGLGGYPICHSCIAASQKEQA